MKKNNLETFSFFNRQGFFFESRNAEIDSPQFQCIQVSRTGHATIRHATILPQQYGTRQYCRDNVTIFSGHKVVRYCNITIFVVATPCTVDTETYTYFSNLFWSLGLYHVVALSLS